jgi:hypothetical protein
LQSEYGLHPGYAFNVVYSLQEDLHVIPDHFEKCPKCNGLYDTWQGECCA